MLGPSSIPGRTIEVRLVPGQPTGGQKMVPCTVSLKGMKKAASSLEDFVRSNFMFHGLDPSRPADVFK